MSVQPDDSDSQQLRRSAQRSSRRFLRPLPQLREQIQFGFMLPEYRPRDGDLIPRLPTARATIYFAADVKMLGSGKPLGTGVFCEGPRAEGFTVSASSADMIAVKVRCGALRALLGVPASELSNVTIDLSQVWGRSAIELAEKIAAARQPAERFALLQRALIEKCRDRGDEDRAAIAISSHIQRNAGRGLVAELVDRSGYSHRALLQKFHEAVGLTPKECLRVARLRGTIARILDTRTPDWAEIAVSSGYYDQAHLIHEFRAMLGLSPGDFIRRATAYSPIGGPALGRQSLPRAEQKIYRVVGMVSKWAGP